MPRRRVSALRPLMHQKVTLWKSGGVCEGANTHLIFLLFEEEEEEMGLKTDTCPNMSDIFMEMKTYEMQMLWEK